jgi:hypothetical protein
MAHVASAIGVVCWRCRGWGFEPNEGKKKKNYPANIEKIWGATCHLWTGPYRPVISQSMPCQLPHHHRTTQSHV